jgi:death-on-curing protein
VLENYGGGLAGILKPSELDAAVHSPQASYDGEYLYRDEFGVAAAYLFLALSHPFLEGNKRTGWLAALAFLSMNGIEVAVPEDDGIACVTLIAEGKEKDWEVVADWLKGFVVD